VPLDFELRLAEVDHHRGGPETAGFDSDIEQPGGEPDSSDGLGQGIQVPPDQATEDKANQWKNYIG
jgi:hypothetical protein